MLVFLALANSMATVTHLSELFQAIARSDISGAKAVAERVVEDFEHKGQHSAARSLKGSLASNGVNPSTPRIAQTFNVFQLNGALTRLTAKRPLTEVSLRPGT